MLQTEHGEIEIDVNDRKVDGELDVSQLESHLRRHASRHTQSCVIPPCSFSRRQPLRMRRSSRAETYRTASAKDPRGADALCDALGGAVEQFAKSEPRHQRR